MQENIIKDSIFIQIAACEERFIELTVKSALHNAKNPENLYFGIFNNIINREHSLLDNDFIANNDKIFYTEIITPTPMGVGFGRMNASLLQFDFFDYSFQIDAHTLFTKNWDQKLINSFNKIKNESNVDSDQIILSASSSLCWSFLKNNLNEIEFFTFDYDNKKIKIENPLNLEKVFIEKIKSGNTKNTFLYNGKQGNIIVGDNIGFPIVYGEKSVESYGSEYIETNSVHATFMFSKASLSREVMHDPQDTFHGDQTNYSIRLLSKGYRIFSPKYPVFALLNKDNEYHTVEEEYNWRTIQHKQSDIGKKYRKTKYTLGTIFFKKMILGEYYGYWATSDKENLKKVKKDIGYEFRE
jgi:hypothetical protein